jgi:CxxC motif-containing protein (DUF1111 family)
MGVFARSGSFRSIAGAIALASFWGVASSPPAFAQEKLPVTHERPADELEAAARIDGRELFNRQWKPGDERSHGGDGLGPMFNEKSCVACHKDGGVGGGGPRENNAMILTPLVSARPLTLPGEADKPPFTQEELTNVHPGLKTSPSVVLHRFSTTDLYDKWLNARRGSYGPTRTIVDRKFISSLMAKRIETLRGKTHHVPTVKLVDKVTVVATERNTTPLFGAGALDKVSDQELLNAETVRFADWPEVTGRAVRFEDGRVGRFGWKSQQPSLREFVATACAVELGLQVPDFHQSMDPRNPSNDEEKGLDLNHAEVTALAIFVAGLDKPATRMGLTDAEKKIAASGLQAFKAVGCAACHRPELGSLKGAYTDLLVHDIGPQLADTGQYYAMSTPPLEALQLAGEQRADASPADRNEWRTPPLWGLRDSAPYMHDGRADTIEEAIAWHGGEANRSVAAYFSLSAARKTALLAFLDTLAAPKNVPAKPNAAAEVAAPVFRPTSLPRAAVKRVD